MEIIIRKSITDLATEKLWLAAGIQEKTVEEGQPLPPGTVCYDASSSDAPLRDRFSDAGFDARFLAIPVYLRRVIQAIANIYPLDRYLAAHYERQLTAVMRRLKEEDIRTLDARALEENFDLTGREATDAVLRVQRKLYLADQRQD